METIIHVHWSISSGDGHEEPRRKQAQPSQICRQIPKTHVRSGRKQSKAMVNKIPDPRSGSGINDHCQKSMFLKKISNDCHRFRVSRRSVRCAWKFFVNLVDIFLFRKRSQPLMSSVIAYLCMRMIVIGQSGCLPRRDGCIL